VQGPMVKRVCLGVKQILTNEGECKGWSPMIPKMQSHFGSYIREGVANVQNLGWKGKKTPN
jgi:hypothetical protein